VTNYDFGLIYNTSRSWLKPKKLTHWIKKIYVCIQYKIMLQYFWGPCYKIE